MNILRVNKMNFLLIWFCTAVLGTFAETTNVSDVNCDVDSNCHQIISEEHNPYKEAARKSLLMRHRAYGYFQVRPGVHLFYQLYYANGVRFGAENKPLIVWIQGGPGFAASGIGNFAEIGPLTMDFKPRDHTWVKKYNVLLIDHPVDAGFSYATNDSLLVTSDSEMAIDLSKAIKIFLRRRKEFRNTPTYLIGQSYGGKICPRLAFYLFTAINNKDLEMNFKGIGIGGGWVNPKESTLMQPELLYHLGAIDRELYIECKNLAKEMAAALDRGEYSNAAVLDTVLFNTINREGQINFNKFNTRNPFDDLDKLEDKMNKYVKPTLRNVNQTIQWKYISYKGHRNLQQSFSVPSYSFLESILEKSNLTVVIYNGNMDIITPAAGASNWVHMLKWHGAADFLKAKRSVINGVGNGFYKEWKQLSFWTVFNAGHWGMMVTPYPLNKVWSTDRRKIIPEVPEDNPEAMDQILDYLTSDRKIEE